MRKKLPLLAGSLAGLAIILSSLQAADAPAPAPAAASSTTKAGPGGLHHHYCSSSRNRSRSRFELLGQTRPQQVAPGFR